MGVASALAAGQAAANSLLTDTCLITKPGVGKGPFNQETGQYDPPAPITVYEGKCKLQGPALVNPFQSAAPDATWQVEQSILSLPVVGSEDVASAMTVTYLTAAYDQALPGRVFGVVGPHHESAATARRLLVKEIVGSGA